MYLYVYSCMCVLHKCFLMQQINLYKLASFGIESSAKTLILDICIEIICWARSLLCLVSIFFFLNFCTQKTNYGDGLITSGQLDQL